MRALALACLLLSIVLSSCTKGKPMPVHHVIYDQDTFDHLNLRANKDMSMATYNSELYFNGDIYNGKLFVKKFNNDHYKLAYTTDAGFKLYALELTDSSIHWDYCLTDMDRKYVKKVLERNFRALLALVPQTMPMVTSREENPHSILGSPKDNVYIYWTDQTKKQVYKVLYTNGKEVLVIVHYLKYAEGYPYRIKVTDHVAQMNLTLVISKDN